MTRRWNDIVIDVVLSSFRTNVLPEILQESSQSSQALLPPAPIGDGQGDGTPRREQWVHLASLLWLLFTSGTSGCRPLLRQLLCWVAFMLEKSPWLMASTTDALRAPIPQGNKRARVVDERVKDAVVAASSSGAFGRSSSKVLTAMGRMRTRKFHLKPQTGNKFDTSRVARYRKAGQKLFRGIHGSVLSVVMDATRVSKKDMLFSAAFCPHVCQGLWLPPQVPFFVVAAGRKQRATRRRKPPETRRRKTHGARPITPETHQTAPNRRKQRTKPHQTAGNKDRRKPHQTAGNRRKAHAIAEGTSGPPAAGAGRG